MHVYYWRGKKNFGDLITPLLIKRFSHLPAIWAPPKVAELVMAGSILEHLDPIYRGVIAGSGKLHEGTKVDFPNARILALRGPLTAKGVKGDFALGDPGLLADELIKDQDRIHNLGLVPHWSDTQLEHNPIFTKYNPKIIRVDDDPLKVITEIAQCKKIVSSSLHGIILADAFGIPRRIELAPRMISHPHQEGGDFKWRDYSASIEMEFKTGVTELADRNIITDRQHELFDVFQEISRIFS